MNKTKKYVINGRRILFNILLILSIFMIYSILTSQIFGKRELKTSSLEIKQGDTLWKISSEICKKDTSLNIQEVLYDIKEINGLDSNNILAGDVIQVPIYD